MSNYRTLVLMIVLFAATLLTSACSISIDGEQVFDGRVITEGSFTLPNSRDGNEINESLVIFGGSVTLLEDSKVNGDVVVFGGNADISGEITNDLIVFGGNVKLSDEAVIRQDLVSFGSTVKRAPNAVVDGQVITELDFSDVDFLDISIDPPYIAGVNRMFGNRFGVASVLGYFFNVLAITAVAVLVLLFLPKQSETTADAIISQPISAGGLGCLTLFVVIFVGCILMFTVILIPVSLLAFFLLALGSLFGLVTVGLVIGRRLAEALDRNWVPVVEAAVGTLMIGIVAGGLQFAGPLGFLVWVAIISVGLGAVVISRFGTRGPKSDHMTVVEVEEPEVKPKVVTKSKTKAKAQPKKAKPKSPPKK